jgi:hypothetical protein
LNVLEVLLGRIEQFVALAPAFLGQGGVLAHDEALAREVRAFNLGEIAIVEQRQLQGATFGGELLDGGRAQRSDPVEPGRLELSFDASLGDHPAVADHDNAFEPEALLELGDLIAECRWIAGVAFEHFDRDRTAVGRAQKSEHDLHLVRPAVPRMTKARQLAAASLYVARTHVIEHQRPVAQVLPRQCCLDRRLRHAQPVECSVDFLEIDRTQPERHAEGVGGRRLVKRPRRGKLCGRIDQPRHDQRHSEVAPALWSVRQKLIKPDPTRQAQRRRNVPMRQRAHDLQAFARRNQLVAAQSRP